MFGRVDGGHGNRDGTEPGAVSSVRRLAIPSSFVVSYQRRDGALGVDPAELVALVRVALAVERPRVAGADELVAGDVTLGEIVVEVRAPARNAAQRTVGAAPDDVVVGPRCDLNLDGTHLAPRNRRPRNLGRI